MVSRAKTSLTQLNPRPVIWSGMKSREMSIILAITMHDNGKNFGYNMNLFCNIIDWLHI